jgi:WG containing repeat
MVFHLLIQLCLVFLSAITVPATRAYSQEMVIAPQFKEAGNFHKGVAPVLVDKLWGLIDRSGAFVVRPKYAGMKRGGNGLFGVLDGGAWGFINTAGAFIITPKFEDAEPFENGVAAVEMGGKWGYVRPDGTMETPFLFLEIGGREGQYVSARDGEGWAVFKSIANSRPKRGEIYGARRAFSISEGTVIFQDDRGEKLAEIVPDKENGFDVETLFPRIFDNRSKYLSIRRMSEGLAPASTAANKWGYLHRNSGEFLWPGGFEDAQNFSQGFAPVKINGKWGYIDRMAKFAVRPIYDAAFPLRGNYAVIREGQKRGFLWLDPQGGLYVTIIPQYDDAFRFTEGLAPVKVGEQWGYISDGRPWGELVDTGIVNIRPR